MGEELEMQNLPLRRHLRHNITRLCKKKVTLKTQAAATKAAAPPAEKGTKASQLASLLARQAKKGKKVVEPEEMDDDDFDIDEIEAMEDIIKSKKKKKKGQEEEGARPTFGGDGDDAFSMDEMNKFADLAEGR